MTRSQIVTLKKITAILFIAPLAYLIILLLTQGGGFENLIQDPLAFIPTVAGAMAGIIVGTLGFPVCMIIGAREMFRVSRKGDIWVRVLSIILICIIILFCHDRVSDYFETTDNQKTICSKTAKDISDPGEDLTTLDRDATAQEFQNCMVEIKYNSQFFFPSALLVIYLISLSVSFIPSKNNAA